MLRIVTENVLIDIFVIIYHQKLSFGRNKVVVVLRQSICHSMELERRCYLISSDVWR
ncbi:hypothetical protein XM72_c11192 [Vibrio vulnificus]|nr:hypothetical protein XM72_c11192 [Vibrio vulnificus]